MGVRPLLLAVLPEPQALKQVVVVAAEPVWEVAAEKSGVEIRTQWDGAAAVELESEESSQ